MFFPPCVTFCGLVDVVLHNQRYPVKLTHGVGPFSIATQVPFQMLDALKWNNMKTSDLLWDNYVTG